MTIKTITLAGTETRAAYSGGANAWLRNDSTGAVYASAAPGVTAGADGVVSIPAGGKAVIYGACGAVYLLGTGSVLLVGSDYTASPFESSAASGGSGADEVARAAIEAHEADTDIHVTAADKEKWNGISNPNLLDNPDFSINQRGKTSYSDGYAVDRWRVYNGKVEVGGGHITLEALDALTVASLRQTMENSPGLVGKTVTFSVDWDILNAGSRCCLQLKYNNEWSQQVFFTEVGRNISAVTVQLPAELTTAVEAAIMIHTPVTADVVGKAKLYSAKLEIGGYATPFCPPNPAVELEKCQRYYQIRSTNDIAAVDLRPTMRTTPTDIKAVTGGYAYVAEF
ncbi:MAG: hypothetical protein J6A19_12830 [Oscillospiraceae bacterium]|nr:hypothetical protein [Oscillospiraceae bacterium]